MISYQASKIISESGIINDAYLIVNDEKIIGIGKEPAKNGEVVCFSNSIISPGFIDVHTHGGVGYETGKGSFAELSEWTRFEIKQGVTGFLPSTPSVPLDQLKKAAHDVKLAMKEPYTNILGMHMEGPFFRKGKKIGAQNPEYIIEDLPEEYMEFIKNNSSIIAYLSLDPQHNYAETIVSNCNCWGIKVAAAHSEILYNDFLEKKASYSSIIHTFNGMIGLDHREPGLAYAACFDDDLYAEIICDGFHVDYLMLALFFKLKGYQKPVLITDAMLAAGMPPGSAYRLGNIEVTVNEDGKVVKEDGGLASSTLTLDKAVRNIVQYVGVPLDKAIQMASLNPAKLLGIDDKKGSIKEGKDADFIVLNSELEVMETYIKGENLYRKTDTDGKYVGKL